MLVQERQNQLKALRQILLGLNQDEKNDLFQSAKNTNPWFTLSNLESAWEGVIELLNPDALDEFLKTYNLSSAGKKQIGLILAGNIPAVGFHDLVVAYLTAKQVNVKLSTQDNVLMSFFIRELNDLEIGNKPIVIVDKLKLDELDGVIATGSNNTARYFEAYFEKLPSVIRRNRSSVAVLRGEESFDELKDLGKDVLTYFGLGCRNVSKLYVPMDYNFEDFFKAIQGWELINDHSKYHNNYAYQKSVFLVNQTPHLDNGFLLVKRDDGLHAPIGVLHFEEYQDLTQLEERLDSLQDEIQCVAGKEKIGFGETQKPSIADFADGVDTMRFILD